MATQEGQKRTFTQDIIEATRPFLRQEHDIEEQAILIAQARERDTLLRIKGSVFDIYEYELNGTEWVRLQYDSSVIAACLYRNHINEENFAALRIGDELQILRENQGRIIRGLTTPQYMIAQITSRNGLVYQSPGFTMPGSIEVPTP